MYVSGKKPEANKWAVQIQPLIIIMQEASSDELESPGPCNLNNPII